MTSFKNVVIAGVTGNLGPEVAKALLATGQYKVSALKRPSSTSPIPDGVTPIEVDYESPESVLKALQGQDVVISTLNPAGLDAQKALIDGSIKAGVKRFFPSEFGSDMDEEFVRSLPVFGYKVAVEEYIKSKIPGTDLSYTFVFNGPFLDWGIEYGFIIDAKSKTAKIYDSGNKPFSTATLHGIALGVVGALQHPEETKNRSVRISQVVTSQNEILELAQKASGKEFEITKFDAKKVLDESFAAVKAGDYSMPVMYSFLTAGLLGGDFDTVFKKTDNELLGIPQLSKEQLAAIVANAL